MLSGILLGALVGFILAITPGVSPLSMVLFTSVVDVRNSSFTYSFLVTGYLVASLTGSAKEIYSPRTSGDMTTVIQPNGLAACQRSLVKLVQMKIGGLLAAGVLAPVAVLADWMGTMKLIPGIAMACIVVAYEPAALRPMVVGSLFMLGASHIGLSQPVYLLGLLFIMLPRALWTCNFLIEVEQQPAGYIRDIAHEVEIIREKTYSLFGVTHWADTTFDILGASLCGVLSLFTLGIGPEVVAQIMSRVQHPVPLVLSEYRLRAAAATSCVEGIGILGVAAGINTGKSVIGEKVSFWAGGMDVLLVLFVVGLAALLGCLLVPLALRLLPDREVPVQRWMNLGFVVFNIVIISKAWLPLVAVVGMFLIHEQVKLAQNERFIDSPVLYNSLIYAPTAWLAPAKFFRHLG